MIRLIKRELSLREDDAISEDIKSLFEALSLTHSKVRLNVPRHLATIRFLKIPSTNDDEIRKIIKIESLKHLPYTDEDIIYGHRIIEKKEDGYSNVLLAIVQAATINRFINILNMARLETESISLGSEGLSLWYLLAKGDKVRENTMLVNVDSDYIDIDVIEDGKLLFTRGVTYDSNDSRASEKIIDQIMISTTAYQKESAKNVSSIILTGTRDRIRECEELLKKASKTPVEMIDQMESMPIGENAYTDLKDASFVELLGCALKPEDIKIDLTPENILEEARIKSSKRNLALTLILAALITVMIFSALMKQMHDKAVYLSYINSELKRIEPTVVKAKKMMRDIDVIKRELEKKPLAIDILSEVYKSTPQGVSLNVLDYESNRALTIRGAAPALSEVFKYVTVLETSSFLENVKVKYATKRVVENRELADFEINCRLSQVK